jgi:uncharacterized protein YuzE
VLNVEDVGLAISADLDDRHRPIFWQPEPGEEGGAPRTSGACRGSRGGREGLLSISAGRILLDMRVTYDVETDAAYVYLTEEVLPTGRDSVPCDPPEGVHHVFVVMDWRDGRIVGMEVLDASRLLHHDLLDNAEKVGR